MSIKKWTNKQKVVHTFNRILFGLKEEGKSNNSNVLEFIDKTWMNLEGIMLSEINQSQKDMYYMITFTWT